jgi:hypothetical protein
MGQEAGFASLIVSFVALLLSARRDVAGTRPTLVFVYGPMRSADSVEGGWAIENICNGPVLDVVFTRVRGSAIAEAASWITSDSILPRS